MKKTTSFLAGAIAALALYWGAASALDALSRESPDREWSEMPHGEKMWYGRERAASAIQAFLAAKPAGRMGARAAEIERMIGAEGCAREASSIRDGVGEKVEAASAMFVLAEELSRSGAHRAASYERIKALELLSAAAEGEALAIALDGRSNLP